MGFKFEKLSMPGPVLITPDVFDTEHGPFEETYKYSIFKKNGITQEFRQDNHSYCNSGVLHGLHYQLKPAEQAKLVRVANGRIFDVAVDIRKGSPHFKKWVGVELSADNKKIFYLPEGFAHGFVALEESEILYKVTNEYSKLQERGVAWNDPDIGIKWPVQKPKMSEKDSKQPRLKDAENNF